MRVLWLSGDLPYPRDSGRRAYSAGLSESLARASVDVHGIGVADASTAPPECRVRWHPVAPADDPGDVRRLCSRWPAMAVRLMTPAYREAVSRTVDSGGFDVAVVDHLQMAWTLGDLLDARLPVVYVSHNHETSLRRGVAATELWGSVRKPLLAYDAERAARAERRLVDAATLVTAITSADARQYDDDGAERVVVVPPGYDGHRTVARTIDDTVPRTVAMVTNLEWHVKQSNLRRLLAVADDRLAAAGITLRIIGPAPASFVDEVRPRLRATEFVGRVPSLERELADARVGIVFEPDGGGFKLKALDYVFHRVPMAVLAGSVEGLPLQAGEGYASFASPEELADGIVGLVDDIERCQALQERAYAECATAFDWSDRGERLADALAGLVTA